jgi:hypothetical protein
VTATFPSAVALGKRRREAEQPRDDGGPAGTQTDEMPPPKRARGGGTERGILKARSVARARPKPATARIPNSKTSDKPKEVGRGAERLATPSSKGVYHRSLPGPSSQRDWSVDAADGTPTWVEGSVDEEAVHHTDKTVKQQDEKATGLFYIPRIFKPEQWLLLQTTEADIARGAVEAIKCRLCPKAQLKNFEEFKRHCRTSEMHPSAPLHFCKRCGDFFARQDSQKRHVAQPPPECRRVTPARAAEKRQRTLDEHYDFVQQMGDALRAGQEIPMGFAVMMKGIYPESSKKRTSDSK